MLSIVRNVIQSHTETPPHTQQDAAPQRTESKCWPGCGEAAIPVRCGRGSTTRQPIVEDSVEVPPEIKAELPFHPVIPLLGT